jgi:ADP-ribose pyrophosphatase
MCKTVSSKEVFKHLRLTLIEDEIILPSGHKIKYLKQRDDGSCAVTIIAERDGKILIQREYSYPPNQKLFQFPGGAVPADEKPEEGANRELMEEMGYRANRLVLLGSYLINNRQSAQKMYVFIGSDLVEECLKKDIEEEIESFWFSEDEITRMIKNGDIINVHLLASWCLYKNKKAL